MPAAAPLSFAWHINYTFAPRANLKNEARADFEKETAPLSLSHTPSGVLWG